MRIFYALLVMGFLVLPAGCGGEEAVSESDGPEVTGPPVDATAEDMNSLMPPPQ